LSNIALKVCKTSSRFLQYQSRCHDIITAHKSRVSMTPSSVPSATKHISSAMLPSARTMRIFQFQQPLRYICNTVRIDRYYRLGRVPCFFPEISFHLNMRLLSSVHNTYFLYVANDCHADIIKMLQFPFYQYRQEMCRKMVYRRWHLLNRQ